MQSKIEKGIVAQANPIKLIIARSALTRKISWLLLPNKFCTKEPCSFEVENKSGKKLESGRCSKYDGKNITALITPKKSQNNKSGYHACINISGKNFFGVLRYSVQDFFGRNPLVKFEC